MYLSEVVTFPLPCRLKSYNLNVDQPRAEYAANELQTP
jgi:hypothetical protein